MAKEDNKKAYQELVLYLRSSLSADNQTIPLSILLHSVITQAESLPLEQRPSFITDYEERQKLMELLEKGHSGIHEEIKFSNRSAAGRKGRYWQLRNQANSNPETLDRMSHDIFNLKVTAIELERDLLFFKEAQRLLSIRNRQG